MRKILIVTPEISGGGIGTYYRNLIPQLLKEGVDVLLAIPGQISGEFKKEFPSRIVEITKEKQLPFSERLNHLNIFPLLKKALATSWAVYDTLKTEHFDIIEISDYPLLFVPWVLERRNEPILIKLHGSLGQIEQFENRKGQQIQTSLLRFIEDRCISAAEGVMSYSRLNRQYWESRLNQKIYQHPPFFQPLTNNTISGELTNSALVLGRVQTWKGPEELCMAAELLGEDCPAIQWVGGDNYFREYSCSMSDHLKSKYVAWGTKIVHTDRVSYEEAQQKLASAKFLIVPSLWDTFNFTAIEGMAKGKVVICSSGAGAFEHFTDGENGFVYPSNDVKALAEKIRQVDRLSRKDLERIGENARATAREFFASDKPVLDRIIIFEELIKKGLKSKDGLDLEWLKGWLSPQPKLNAADPFPEILLDQLPLKYLANYFQKRIIKKFK